jgi:hypothetical protein
MMRSQKSIPMGSEETGRPVILRSRAFYFGAPLLKTDSSIKKTRSGERVNPSYGGWRRQE